LSARILVLVGLALAASSCISKGDTNIGNREESSKNDDDKDEPDASVATEDTGDDDPTTDETTSDDDESTADDVSSDDQDDAVTDDATTSNDDDATDDPTASDDSTDETSSDDSTDETTGDETTEPPADPCDPDPCRNDGVCTEVDGDFECDCGDSGYIGKRCEKPGYLELAAGGASTCALMADHSVKCWGADAMSLEGTFTKVTVGAGQICAIRDDKTLQCFGGNLEPDPEAIIPDGEFIDVGLSGQTLGCALDTAGKILCWGDERLSEPPEDEGFEHIDVSGAHACALKPNGEVACWHGTLSNDPDLSGLFKSIELNPNTVAACGIDLDDHVVCAGLGDAPEIDTEGKYLQVAMTWYAVCGLSAETHRVSCWNLPSLASSVSSPPPKLFDQIACGADHCCALRNHEVECWGSNPSGLSPMD
jgi:hypothetical protein